MSASVNVSERIAQCQLQPCDDGLRLFRIVADGVDVGEIRSISPHSRGIYLLSRRLLLRDDTTAAAIASGTSRWRVFAQQLLQSSRCWSLHEGDQEIAQLQLRSQKQDERIELHAASESWSVLPRSAPGSAMDLLYGGAITGSLRFTGWASDGIVLDCNGLPLPQAVALLVVAWHSWRPHHVV